MKKKRAKNKAPMIGLLPVDNVLMERYVTENKREIRLNIVNQIEWALENCELMIQIFQYDNSPFAIMLNSRDFKENLEFFLADAIKQEDYELCNKIKTILPKLDTPRYNKHYKKLKLI